MPVRATMSNLITRVRLLINDPASVNQQWSDSVIQDILDARRQDVQNGTTTPKPTFSGSTIQYLDYYTELGDWEDDLVLKQYLTIPVTPSTSENIVGHWQFTTTTLPPIYISGKTYCVYGAAADLLERWAASFVMSYSFSSDGQSFQRQQVAPALQALAKTYRRQQRAGVISMTRSDLSGTGTEDALSLAPRNIDYFSSGSGT